MDWKPNTWILVGVLLAAALTTAGMAQVATTQVTDTIYHADGSVATGTAIISWPAFTTGSGDAIPSGSLSTTIAAGGALSVQLVPNGGATPIGSYYTVVYHLDDGTVSRQYWVVPASTAPVTVSAIESTVLPVSVAMQTVSKSYVDTAIAAAVSGHPLDSTPYVLKAGDAMAGPLLLPADPVSAAQAADKHYVDASVAALSGGLEQGGGMAPQAEYAVPAYLLSPSGGMALPGASHLSVDPAGYNLSGYHTNFTNLGVSAAQADCTQPGALFGGNSCAALSATYSSDTGVGEWGQVVNYSAYGVGQNLGNDGVGTQGRGGNAFGINASFRSRHTNAANIISMYGSAVGDWGPWYVYDYDDGGSQAPSDEGTKVLGTYEGGETFGYWHGTILTGGSGATLPTFNYTGGCGTFNACTPTDGGILIDTQTAVASGYLNGASTAWSGSGSPVPLMTIPVAGVTLPTTTAWGHAEGISIPPQPERLPAAPATIALTMVTGTFSAGDQVCVEGTATTGGWDEQSIITNVSGGNVTLPLAYPYTNIAIFKGGPCGTFISFSANLALSGYRTSYHAIASFTGSDLIYAVPSGSGLNGALPPGGLPQAGSEPETTGGTGDANAAFQTFCGAEIDAALQPNGDAVQIDPNSCPWAVGDTVESPHFPTQDVTGLWALVNQNMPNNSKGAGQGALIELSGMGIANTALGYKVENLNSNTWYQNGGGKLLEPACAYCGTGTWYDSFLMDAPVHSLIDIDAHLPGQSSYNIFNDTVGGFGGTLTLSAAGWVFSGNGAGITCYSCGFTGAAFFANANIDTKNAGGTSEISVINGTLTSATASFTQAGYTGTRADFGSVAFGTTTPVTPLLSIKTDDVFEGVNGAELDAYTSGGTAVPVVFAASGPGVSNTNLSLEDGMTDCSTLICLGPDATVDSSGALTVTSCTGCGGGGSYPQVTSLILGSGGSTYAGLQMLGTGGDGLPTNLVSLIGQQTAVTNNTLYDGTNWVYQVNGGASGFRFPNSATGAGQFELNTCPVGAASATAPVDTTCVLEWAQNTSAGNQLWLNSQSNAPSWPSNAAFVLNPAANDWWDFSGNETKASGTVLGWNGDTGLSRDSAGVVDVGNGTAGDKSGTIDAALYQGPATAPSGSCSAVGWAFSQDGHATFCNGSTWATKI